MHQCFQLKQNNLTIHLSVLLLGIILSGCSLRIETPAFSIDEIEFSTSLSEYSAEDVMLILTEFAPIVYQNSRGDIPGGYTYYRTGDYILKANFDGDWNSLNNWENCRDKIGDFTGYCYASLTETESHYFAAYHFFHAMDDSVFEIDRHENDLENAIIAIRKNDKQIEGVITNKHGWDRCFSSYYQSLDPVLLENGRVPLYISSNGSGIDFGHGIDVWQGRGKHPFEYELIKYHPEQEPTMPIPLKNEIAETGYRLIGLDDTVEGLWIRRENRSNEPFSKKGGFGGDTFGAGAGTPWAWDQGYALFNPAALFSLAFPDIETESYSYLYSYNPYAAEIQ